MNRRVYLDYNASTPVAAEVLDAMRPFAADCYGNPHTRHWAGRAGGAAIETAREHVAALVGCEPEEVHFTAGATEANNWAIKGVYFANRARGDHFVSSAIEHPSVRAPLAWLAERFGARVTLVEVDGRGRVSPEDIRRAITPRTLLVSLMHANNEVGTIQPVAEAAAVARARGVLAHCDAAQTLGKIPVSMPALGVDLLSIAGHKMYAPKGVGALCIRRGTPIDPLIHGAGQEGGRRGGTENVANIVGLGKACELALRTAAGDDAARRESLRELRDYFWRRLRESFGDEVVLHGHVEERLPNTLNVGFRGLVGGELLEQLEDVAATTGSACNDGDVQLSPTLAAMRVDPAFGRGAVRWSLGHGTTRADIDYVLWRLQELVPKLRRSGP